MASEVGLPKSMFVMDDAEVHEVPMSVIRRPLIPSLDNCKVEQFMENIKAGHDMTPIEVAWVETPEGNYYFAFGGCHRWEAHQRLNKNTILAKLVKMTPSAINLYLGASSPFRNLGRSNIDAPPAHAPAPS